MLKETYERTDMEIVSFGTDDVITTSDGNETSKGDNLPFVPADN